MPVIRSPSIRPAANMMLAILPLDNAVKQTQVRISTQDRIVLSGCADPDRQLSKGAAILVSAWPCDLLRQALGFATDNGRQELDRMDGRDLELRHRLQAHQSWLRQLLCGCPIPPTASHGRDPLSEWFSANAPRGPAPTAASLARTPPDLREQHERSLPQ